MEMLIKFIIVFIYLGCEKNCIDIEYIIGLFVQVGYEVDVNEELVDYVVVNICSFI